MKLGNPFKKLLKTRGFLEGLESRIVHPAVIVCEGRKIELSYQKLKEYEATLELQLGKKPTIRQLFAYATNGEVLRD